MANFSVSYDIVTPESAEDGDAAERGYVAENVSLRDASQDFTRGRTSRADSGDGLEIGDAWFTYRHGMEFETGAYETRYLHFPRTITPASHGRLARLMGAK